MNLYSRNRDWDKRIGLPFTKRQQKEILEKDKKPKKMQDERD